MMDESASVEVAPGESVYAAMTQRLFAYLLDLIPINGLTLLSCSFFPGAPVLIAALCFHLYMICLHGLTGTTVGKYLLGIEVAQEPGSTMPRIVAILLRETIGRAVSSVPFFAGYWLPSNAKNKAWSDSIAGTVVQERKVKSDARIALVVLLAVIVLFYLGFRPEFK